MTYSLFILVCEWGLFTHVVPCVGHTFQLPLANVFIPVDILLYHLLVGKNNNTEIAYLCKQKVLFMPLYRCCYCYSYYYYYYYHHHHYYHYHYYYYDYYKKSLFYYKT